VAFSGVERFIDTPVKRYSSGMQMRLAFAVAAHLEPHILLVDEVLAVGDSEFQRKCLGKMHEVSEQGRTVLLVSHQMGQIRRLCQTVIWLDRGRVRAIGPAGETIHEYERAATVQDPDAARGGIFTGWSLGDRSHVLRDDALPFVVRVQLKPGRKVANGHFGLGLVDADDEVVAGWAFEPIRLEGTERHLDVTIPQLPIRPGLYRWTFALFDGGNNMTGGHLVEKWAGVPELSLDVRPVGHPQDAWAGLLNVRGTLHIEGQPAVVVSAGSEDIAAVP
jgi:energy-coupling factor transporter ATP-binding protein EcfA2